MTVSDTQWSDIDPWWQQVSRARTDDLEAIEELLKELDAQWRASRCVFDTDPLAADWDGSGPQSGPLRTNQEENWSQWLAHLLDSAPEHFYSTLLVEPPAGVPRRVRCEVGYGSDSEHDRRADIVLEFPTHGVSIEVKIDDEGYSKTVETATLIENRAPSLAWSHYLLLPRYKRERLASIMDDQYTEGVEEQSVLRAPALDCDAVDVLFWEDVSFALRQTLLSDEPGSPHWQASAYLFITHIEQQLCRFYPKPTIQKRVQESSALAVSDLAQLQIVDPERQRNYLTKLLELIQTND